MFTKITAAGLAVPVLIVALAAGNSFGQVTDTLVVPIKAGSDDAEESVDGTVNLGSSDLELINDEVDQIVGLRFQDIALPNGATIVRAYVQFHVHEPGSSDSALVIHGQAADDASPFSATLGDVSSRPQTKASAKWWPPPWTTTEETGAGRRTPNLAEIIQEIVNRDGWQSGKNIALIISGSGTRTAPSFNGDAGKAAQLHVDFLTSDLPTQAPLTALVVPIKAGSDDAEESVDGTVNLGSSDLELINDEVDQIVGLRFQDIALPNGATIVRAYIQFHVDEPGSSESELIIHGQAADDASPFSATPGDVSSRPQTKASAKWWPPPWTTTEESGAGRRTPDLAEIIQEIVNRDGWHSGNGIALIISGSGTRTAPSFDGDTGKAAQLHIIVPTGMP